MMFRGSSTIGGEAELDIDNKQLQTRNIDKEKALPGEKHQIRRSSTGFVLFFYTWITSIFL